MSIINNQYFSGGNIPTAAELNAVYDSVASSTVVDDNIDVDWANRNFLDKDTASKFINLGYFFDYDGTTKWPIPNGYLLYTTIENVSGTKSMVSPNYVCKGKALVRVHASGIIEDIAIDASAMDGNGTTAQTNYNVYSFKVKMSLNGSGTPSTVDICTGAYSLTRKAIETNQTTSAAVRKAINYRSFCISGIAILDANDIIDTVELQAVKGLDAQTINIGHNHLQVIIVEN